MLTISRRAGEKIILDFNGVQVVIEVQRNKNQVRLGIEAPMEVKIFRKELLDKIEKEKLESACE